MLNCSFTGDILSPTYWSSITSKDVLTGFKQTIMELIVNFLFNSSSGHRNKTAGIIEFEHVPSYGTGFTGLLYMLQITCVWLSLLWLVSSSNEGGGAYRAVITCFLCCLYIKQTQFSLLKTFHRGRFNLGFLTKLYKILSDRSPKSLIH